MEDQLGACKIRKGLKNLKQQFSWQYYGKFAEIILFSL